MSANLQDLSATFDEGAHAHAVQQQRALLLRWKPAVDWVPVVLLASSGGGRLVPVAASALLVPWHPAQIE